MNRPRSGSGILLATSTACCWGIMPLVMKPVAIVLHPLSSTWFRCALSGTALLTLLWRRGQLGQLRLLCLQAGWLSVFLIAGLVGNFSLYIASLRLVSEVVCQVSIQLAPAFLALASLFIFHERFNRIQWCGCALLVAGYAIFLHYRLLSIPDPGNLIKGVLLLVASAACWMLYAVAQKRLLSTFSPLVILTLTFMGCAIVLLPFSSMPDIIQLDLPHGLFLIAGGIASLLGYIAFVSALDVWTASRVSAAITTAPIFTIVFVAIASALLPAWIAPSHLPVMSLVGAMLVVAGSMVTSLAKDQEKVKPPASSQNRVST